MIEDEIPKVQSRDERWWEVGVTCNGQIHSYLAPTGLAAARIDILESGDDASLGNGDGLLFLDKWMFRLQTQGLTTD